MSEQINAIERSVFLWFNGMHTEWSDQFFWFITQSKHWIPLYIILIILLYWKFSWQRATMLLIGVLIAVGLGDFIASQIFKPWIARPRPSHDPVLEGLVHIVNGYRGGQFGFMSSHSSTSMAIAAFFIYTLGKKYKITYLLLLWSIFYSYSRIAIGVHYVGDVLAGWTVGIISAYIAYLIVQKIWSTIQVKYDIHEKLCER